MSGAKRGVAQRSHKANPCTNLSWQEHANCTEVADPDMFFDPGRYSQALTVCAGCPVKAQCREYGKSMGGGVWGGEVFLQQNYSGLSTFLLKPCGTEAAQARHRRKGELCEKCRDVTSTRERRA